MRHNKKINHLGRKSAHRKAMLSNMATSLIMHKRIFTTVPKAKALRKFVEPIITKSKDDTTNSRRVVFSMLQSKQAVTELFQEVSQKVADRPGGYTRIIKTGYRLGDNAAMCFIELVDFNENMLSDGGAKKAKTRRSRRKKSSDSEPATTPKAKKEAKTEEPKAAKTEKVKTEEAPPEEAAADTSAKEVQPEKVDEVSKEEKQEIKEEKKTESMEDQVVEHNPATDDNKEVPKPRDNA